MLVTRAEDKFDRYVTQSPLIAIEILSPEDTLQAMQGKAAEYRQFGIDNIWIIDPEPRIAYRYSSFGLEEVRAGELVVTKHTTLLVVGDQDLRKLNGQEKISKHRKAEQLIAKGQALRILGESDFK